MLEIKAHAYERKKSSFLRRGKRREIELCRAKELGDMGRMAERCSDIFEFSSFVRQVEGSGHRAVFSNLDRNYGLKAIIESRDGSEVLELMVVLGGLAKGEGESVNILPVLRAEIPISCPSAVALTECRVY